VTSPPIEDPSEKELLLLNDAGVLAFGPHAFELETEELVRWIGVDLAARIPVEVGAVSERYPAGGGSAEVVYAARIFQLGTTLAIATCIEEPLGSHRVVEVLGMKGDVRARVNMTRARSQLAHMTARPDRNGAGTKKLTADSSGASEGDRLVGGREQEVESKGGEVPEALGNVRVWGGEPGEAERAAASIHRHLHLMGLEPQPKDGAEPRFEPPAADRWACELPPLDATVTSALIELLQMAPVEGARTRLPRRLALLEDRVKRVDGGLIAYRFETHRAGTGVVHLRRREVEAGPGRPGLVRTWNLAGLRGGARVRVREVAGRAVAEAGGSREGVAAIARFLETRLSGRQ
jgi:hypothetical protein